MGDEDQQLNVLSGEEDKFEGIVVDLMEVEPITAKDFDAMLKNSLKAWKNQGKKGIWIKLPLKLSHLVDTAIKKGFTYHHAEKEYAMLTTWLADSESTIPDNASHRIGVGGFVLNKNREMLVVQENSGYFKGSDVWKVPTGVITEGECIWAGAIREVKEETNIDTKFVQVLAFKESHEAAWRRKTDIFFLCELEATSFEITKQESEISAAKWMPIEEYVNQPFNQKKEMFRLIADICLKRWQTMEDIGFSTVPSTNSSKDTLYCKA